MWIMKGKSYCCFHSISFPSEWGVGSVESWLQYSIEDLEKVSIQLVSPAGGESTLGKKRHCFIQRFHSISFPSEWGEGLKGNYAFMQGFAAAFPFN